MKLLIVRHGDPDYTIDSLTEKGWKEAEYLSEKLSKLDIKDFYVSPLGRAKDTASLTLKKMNRTATECDWLREFDVLIDRPDVTDRKIILWDWLPQDWTMDERFYQYDHWFENERRFVILTTAANGSMIKVHDRMPLILEKEQLADWFDDKKMEQLLQHTPVMLKREAEYEQQSLFL